MSMLPCGSIYSMRGIVYVFVSDTGHITSKRVLEDIAIKRKQKLYASSLTLVETCNTVCRKIVGEKAWRLIDPLQGYVDVYKGVEERYRLLLSLIVSFLKERLGIGFVDE